MVVDEKSVMGVIRSARPSFRNANDKIAFAVHASFLTAGYIPRATGPPAFADNALSSSTDEEVGIDHWNELGDDYAFVYSSPDNSKKVLVKGLAMNGKLLVDALTNGGRGSDPLHLEINVDDYVTEEKGGPNYGPQYKNFGKLVSLIDKEVVSKLDATPAEIESTQPSISRPRDSAVTEPQDPPPYYPAGVFYPSPVPVGGGDLFPGSGAGMFPTRGDFGVGGGGMYVGPDHPVFGGLGGRGRNPGLPGGLPGVPPGARFDPYGPPDIPGIDPSRFSRHPRRPGGGTHPDLEHFRDGNDYI